MFLLFHPRYPSLLLQTLPVRHVLHGGLTEVDLFVILTRSGPCLRCWVPVVEAGPHRLESYYVSHAEQPLATPPHHDRHQQPQQVRAGGRARGLRGAVQDHEELQGSG